MFLYYILSTISALIFFTGFFPINNSNNKFNNEPPIELNGTSLRRDKIYTSNIVTSVIIVIDALRLDFVTPELMPLTSKIIKTNGCLNKIKVETPTVTLPRIKALTAGNVPQFIDIVLNLFSKEILSDSLIHSAHKGGKRMIFYGDDTWLRLFPAYFTRFEGTTSFFVRDFTEVDDNVTRNVNTELHESDWDMMILHYLGLDHIGHVFGPFSSLVPPKLQEMDNIIDKIYTTLAKKRDPFLLVVTGDHGMRDSGGHGGSTYSETNVPLVLAGVNCTNDSFPQTDIPVNLAVLLGLDIPSISIGQIQQNIFPFDLEKYLYVLRYNNVLLKQKSCVCDDQFDLASKFHENFLKTFERVFALNAIKLYKNCSKLISDSLMKSSVDQNVIFLVVAILLIINIIIVLVSKIFTMNTDNETARIKLLIFYIPLLTFFVWSTDIFFIQIISLLLLLFWNISPFLKQKFFTLNNPTTAFIFFSFVHPLTYISSSFVEEEHQYWYFFNITFAFGCLVYFFRHNNFKNIFKCLILLTMLRFVRTINSTGDKWANYPDLADWLIQEQHLLYYEIFFIFGLVFLFIFQYILADKNSKIHIANFTILFLTYLFKNYCSNVLLGKIIWILIFFHFILFRRKYKIISWTLVLALLLKPYNTILIGFCILSSLTFRKLLQSTEDITFYHIWLGNMLYFAQGHSNSLASVDISVGYIGLTEYQPFLVISQVLCHTYAFIVLVHALIFRNPKVNQTKAWNIIYCYRLYNFLVISIVTFILRHHLFIWSVFAPKLFIEFIHIMFLFIEYCCYVLLKLISLRNNSKLKSSREQENKLGEKSVVGVGRETGTRSANMADLVGCFSL